MYTKEQFVKWLKEQDPNTPHDYTDSSGCAFAMFLRSQGHDWVSVGPRDYDAGDHNYPMIPEINAAVRENYFLGDVLKELTE